MKVAKFSVNYVWLALSSCLVSCGMHTYVQAEGK